MFFDISGDVWYISQFRCNHHYFNGDEEGFSNLCGYIGIFDPAFKFVTYGDKYGLKPSTTVEINCRRENLYIYFTVTLGPSGLLSMFYDDERIHIKDFTGLTPEFICNLFFAQYGKNDICTLMSDMVL